MMKKIWFVSLVALGLSITTATLIQEKIRQKALTRGCGERYQDIIVKNKVIKQASGNHDSATRYELIKEVLNLYERPFTMLDVGAKQGYYSFRTAEDYPATCVLLEGNGPSTSKRTTHLLNLCRANDHLDSIIFLNKPPNTKDLQTLSECEHFDVVLALNVIHRFGDRWKQAADHILNLGDHIIVETPPQEPFASIALNARRKEIEDYLLTKSAKPLGQVLRHTSHMWVPIMSTLYWIEGKRKRITRKTCLLPVEEKHILEITSDFKSKFLTKTYPQIGIQHVHPWVNGINMLTFKMLRGCYPTKETLRASLKKLSREEHTDWMINNMILQGKTITLIDQNDPFFAHRKPKCSKKKLKRHLEIVEIDNPKLVKKYFWQKLL